MGINADAVQRLYVAYFNRPADAVGLDGWQKLLPTDRLATQAELEQLADQGFSGSQEYANLYAGLTNSQIVDQLYVNLFGRHAETAGLNYWANELTQGRQTFASIALQLTFSAQGTDAMAIANKLTAALAFSAAMDTTAEVQGYSGYEAAAQARNWLKDVDHTAASLEAATSSSVLNQAVAAATTANHVANSIFTLQEIVKPGASGVPAQTALYWGYNPHDHEYDPDGSPAPSDGGIPVAELLKFLTTITGLDLAELGLIDANGVDPFQNVTSLSLTNPLSPNTNNSNSGDGTANDNSGDGYVAGIDQSTNLQITFADGTYLNAEVALGSEYFNFLNNLLFDADGNSRLYEKVIVDEQYPSPDTLEPIVLTTNRNNGGTIESDYFNETHFTSAGSDLIVAGRLELLHGAYIDGGDGWDILEVDAKGVYAQPTALLNIEEIRVQNLPNVYNTQNVEQDSGSLLPGGDNTGDITDNTNSQADNDGYLDNSTYPYLSGNGNPNSVLDLSRAVDIERLIITEGTDTGSATYPGTPLGSLTIVGVRNGAVARFEGAFTEDVNLHYGQGLTGPLTIELLLGQVTGNLNFVHNTDALNLVSLGGVANTFGSEDIGGRLSKLTISGDAALYIRGDLDRSFQDDSPVTIDASTNEKGVALELSGSQNVTFYGSLGDDTFIVDTSESDILINNVDDQSVTIVDGGGNNSFEIETEILNVTLLDGNNKVAVDNAESIIMTAGNGNNHFQITDGAEVSIVVGDGDNRMEIEADGLDDEGAVDDSLDYQSNVSIVAGNGQNNIDVEVNDNIGVVTVVAGNGGNTINASAHEVNITTGSAADVIKVLSDIIIINSGGGGDTITIGGWDYDYVGTDELGGNANSHDDENGYHAEWGNDGALVQIDTGSGNATIHLGSGAGYTNIEGDDFPGVSSITAMEGSFITGENITLFVDTVADLRAATLTGITRVVLDDDSFNIDDAPTANDAEGGINAAVLTLTTSQFAAIGAENFSVQGAVFNTHGFIKLIVDETTSLTDLGVDQLPRNIDLLLEVQDGVTLTMTAEQMHTRVAQNGVSLANDGNTDYGNGKVVITGGGLNFDPFNTSDTVRTVIGGTQYLGGSLSDDFMVGNSWYNVTVRSVYNGYDRPADAEVVVVLTIDSTVTQDVGAFSTWHDNLEIVGDQDVNFTGTINLAQGLNGASNLDDGPFNIDFSSLEGVVNNLTVDGFEHLAQGGGIWGNSNNGYASEVLIQIAKDVADDGVGFDEEDAGSLVSQGVSRYVVTVIEGPTANGSAGSTATIKLCDTAQDIEVFALRGNYNDTLVVEDAAWGLVFELQGGGTAKAEGPTGTSNVGTLVANYEWDHAVAVVNLVHSVAGDTRTIHAAGITIDNADSITLNGGDSNVEIESVAGDSVEVLNITSAQDVTIVDELPISLTSIDASGVLGMFTATIDNPDDDFSFIGASGSTHLTLGEFTATSDTSIDGGTGVMVLTIGGDWPGDEIVDLSAATLSNIASVVLTQDAVLNLTIVQMIEIGAANFVLAPDADAATLNLDGLDGEPFALADFATGIDVSVLSIADLPEVTLHADTDLTGISGLMVHEGTILNLTAAQFQQLDGAGTIVGIGGTIDFTVNITDMTQADAEFVDDLSEGFDVSGIAADNFTITLAESVTLTADDDLGSVDTITMGDDMFLSLADIQDADGVEIIGGANSTLIFTDTSAGAFESIDASGFAVTYLKMLNVLVDNRNVDLMFSGLSGSITKVIYNGEGWVDGIDQTVNIEAGTTVPGFVVFNKVENDVEVRNFILNLQGGTEISGNLRLSTSLKVDDNGNDLIQTHLQTVTINSTGSDANLLSGKTANIITGDITSQGTGFQVSYTSVDNNLLNLTINAEQNLIVEGDIIFESVVGDDDVTANDDEEAVATLTVNGSADVTLGALDTSDNDVDALNVVNNSTGTLSLVLDADLLDQEDDNNDALSFTGANIALTIADNGLVDLSDDVLTGVSQITIDGDGELTLTQAQFDALGVANLLPDTDAGTTASLNLVEFGSDPFDATTVAAGITVASITMAAGIITLDPATNLTGVGEIFVPEGGTLNLTAAQFQQLAGIGSISGLDVNGDSVVDDYTVNITDLTQADVTYDANNDGDTTDATDTLDLSDIDGANVTVSLADAHVILGTFADDGSLLSAADLNGADVLLADDQMLSLVNLDQADGLNISGGTNTTLEFLIESIGAFETIDASGFDVDTLRLLDVFVANRDVEFLEDLASDVLVRVFRSLEEMGHVSATNRQVFIEEGVTVPGFLVFNDWQDDSEVRTLTLTMDGGVEIDGNLRLSTVPKAADLIANHFSTLNIISQGTAANFANPAVTANVITGDITGNGIFGTLENNLLNVNINAVQDFIVEGDIIFTSIDEDKTTATLTMTGTADVTVHGLDVSDDDGLQLVGGDIVTLHIANDGTGTFTATGGTPAIFGDIEELILTGTGDMAFGTAVTTPAEGVSSATLSLIDASDLSGDLDLGELESIDSADFTFIAGTGVTKLTLTDDDLDSTGVDTIAGNNDDTAGWTFDFSSAAAGSEFHWAPDWTPADYIDGSILNINLGANTTLYIDEDMDLSGLDLSIIQTLDIVLADGKTLTLTAAQANGLNIVAGPDTGTAGITAKVNIVDLGDTAVDLSGIAADIAGTVTLEDDDVTLAMATDLGDFTVVLDDVAGTDTSLAGQTIRFQTVAQAERAIRVGDFFLGEDTDPGVPVVPETDTVSSTNVVWLFNTIANPNGVDTSGYDAEIGRLWFSDDLINNEGGLVESLFTTLPSTILRVDFADITALNILLASNAVDRTVEFVNFTNVGNLTFSDVGATPEEHIRNLTLQLGGQVTIGNILIDDVVAAPDTDPASVEFDTLTIVSNRALHEDHVLASEGYLNNNNGIAEMRDGIDEDLLLDDPESVQPNNINTVGNIGVGAVNGVSLLNVVIDTLDESVSLEGNGLVNPTAGANLSVGTITYGTATAGSTANLVVTGENDVNITAVNTADVDISALIVDLTGFTAVLTAPGASPAFQLGDNGAVADNNTETLTFTNDDATEGTITLGSALNAGIVGDDLSVIDASGYDGELNLGTIVIDSTNDDSTPLTPANDGLVAAFTFTSGSGVTTMTLGTAVGGTSQLNTDSEWVFDYTDAAAGSSLTITEDAIFQPGAILTLTNVDLYVDGAVDLTEVVLSLTGGLIHVPAGSTLTLTVAQLLQGDMVDIVGSGTVIVTGDATDVAGTALGDHIQTIGVDISAVTILPADADGLVNLSLGVPFGSGVGAAAIDDDGLSAGFNVIGSDVDDEILTWGEEDDTINGGMGHDELYADGGADTLIGGAGDDDLHGAWDDLETFVVDSGTDTIFGLGTGEVMIVSATATANADVAGDFVATAETVNNGTVVLTATGTVDRTIDMSLATGSNGFTITGGTSDTLGADVLIGSDQADIINGGNSVQSNAAAKDTLTGNGGNDTFQVTVDMGNTTTLSLNTTQANVDREEMQITAGAGADGTLTYRYTVNGANSDVSVAVTNGMTAIQVATAIANQLQTNGAFVTSASTGGTDTITVTGQAALDIELVGVVFADGTGVTNAAPAEGTDIAQSVTLSAAGDPTENDQYSVAVTLNDGTFILAQYTALFGDDADDVLAGLATAFNTAAGAVTVNAINAVLTDGILVFEDEAADNGGFSIVTDLTAAFGGSGASADSLDYTTADIITDFVGAGVDKVEFFTLNDTDMQNGDGSNYLEAATVADAAAAEAAANIAFANNSGTLQYYLTSVTDIDGNIATDFNGDSIGDNDAYGMLYFDANLDGTADGVLLLVGVTASNFSAFDIIAS